MANLFTGAPTPCRLLVITHDDFAQAIQPLVDHKNRTGMPAFAVKLSQIVQGLNDPSTHPLAIKKLIAEGHEHHGVYYVMLVGDAGKIPTRHRFVRQPHPEVSGLDGTYNPTDFFYANLYKAGGQAAGLSDWDANKDGKYNEELWVGGSTQTHNPDQVEGFLDVAVGRIPAHTSQDVTNYVIKVIDYEEGLRARCIESFAFLSDDLLDVAGKTSEAIITQSKIETLPNSEVKKFLANTNGPLPSNQWKMMDNVDKGHESFTAKWTIHVGHGNHAGWGIQVKDTVRNISLDFDNSYVTAQSPGRWNVKHSFSLPIVLSAGCETGQFLPNAGYTPDGSYRGFNPPDVTHWIAYDEAHKKATDNGQPIPNWPVTVPPPNPYDFPNEVGRTFAYAWLCDSSTGGAIAYSGATVVHQGGTFGGDLFLRMVRQIKDKNILGDIWAQAARDYLGDKLYLNSDIDLLGAPRIYLSIQSLYGDPSLRLSPIISYGLSAVMAHDRLTVFARTAHGTLTHKYYDSAAQKWIDWSHLGDGQISSVGASIMAGERLTVFARTAHGTLTHKYYDTIVNKWTDWIHLEGNAISSGPAVVMAGDRLTVFARNESGMLTHRFYNPQQQIWTNWIDLGDGQISSAPSAVMAGNRLTVFARTINGTLTHKYYDPDAQVWTNWIHLGDGQISSAPSAVMAGTRLTVFARTLDGTLAHKFYDRDAQAWTDWKFLGEGQISSAPSAVMAGARLTVFARTMHGTLTHKYYDNNIQAWTDWKHLGDGEIS
jgi:hypothetical protein